MGRPRQPAMRSVHPYELGQHLFKLETQILQASPENTVSPSSLRVGIRPGVDQCSHRLVSVEICDRHLELFRRRTAADSGYGHTVTARRFQTDRREVRDYVRSDVMPGVTHLIDQLLGHRGHGYATSRAGVLEDCEGSVRLSLDNRVSGVFEPGNPLPIEETVPARALSAAFDNVAGHGSRGEQIPRIGPPTELMNHWSQSQSRVCHAAGDDDLRSLAERFDDRSRTQVHVGRENPVTNRSERFASVHVGQVMPPGQHLIQSLENVVSRNHPHSDLVAEALLARRVEYRFRAAPWVHAPGIGRNTHVPFDEIRKQVAHQRYEVCRVASARITRALFLHDGHGYFGQVIHHEVVDGTAAHLPPRRFQPVTPEPLPRRDSYGSHGHGAVGPGTCLNEADPS